ncbi:hypothetical protein D3C81_1790870 [compost metagenome]
MPPRPHLLAQLAVRHGFTAFPALNPGKQCLVLHGLPAAQLPRQRPDAVAQHHTAYGVDQAGFRWLATHVQPPQLVGTHGMHGQHLVYLLGFHLDELPTQPMEQFARVVPLKRLLTPDTPGTRTIMLQ